MRNRVISISAFVFLFGVTPAYCENSGNRLDAEGIVWGEVVNGLQLGIAPPLEFNQANECVGVKGPAFDGSTLHVSVHLRNAGKSPVRFLPSTWDCLAMGDDGGIPVSKLVLKQAGSTDAFTVTYQGWNHLRLLDKRRPESESWQETLCKSVPGNEDMQLNAEDAEDRQIVLHEGDTAWPESVEYTPGKNSESLWRLAEESNAVPVGRYQITAVLVVDQEVSEWKGRLTSGTLEVEMRPRETP